MQKGGSDEMYSCAKWRSVRIGIKIEISAVIMSDGRLKMTTRFVQSVCIFVFFHLIYASQNLKLVHSTCRIDRLTQSSCKNYLHIFCIAVS